MKEKIAFLTFLSLGFVFGVFLYADEPSSDFGAVPKLSIGGGAFFVNYISGGGFADFSVLIYNNNHFDIRNHFVLRGAGLNDTGGFLTLSEKLSVGGLVVNKFRSYGYAEGGIGIWGGKNSSSEILLAYSFGGGGGTDLFLSEKSSIFFEAGCLINILEQEWKSGGIFQIGWKGYF